MISTAQSQMVDASLAPMRLRTEISTSVLKKTLNAARDEGAAMVDLIDSAGAVGSGGGGQAGDALVAKATGVGGLLDVMA